MQAFAETRAAVEAAMEEQRVPGAAVGLLAGGEEHVAGLGVTSIENPLPVGPDTLFQIGSITKTYVATAAMRLVEQGRLDLDTPVRRYLPGFRLADEDVAARVTMRHLLSHGGGWAGDYFDDLGWGDDALARIVERLPSLPQLTPLGEVWSYCNSGFCAAGRVLEVVGGSTFEDAIGELVLEPLGVERTLFFPHDVMTHRFVVGHLVEDDLLRVGRPWPIGRAGHPAGGIVSTVGDLLRYARVHLGEDESVLARGSVAAMQEPLLPTGPLYESMALSWFVRDRDGVQTIEHGGTTLGQNARLLLVPSERIAIAVLTNSGRGHALIQRAVDVALEQLLGIPRWEPEPRELDPHPYLGRYVGHLSEAQVERVDGSLVVQLRWTGGFPTPESPPLPPPPPAPAVFYDEDRIFVTEGVARGGEGQFLRGADGELEWFRYAGRLHRRERR